jgi:hypothetical protein
MSQENTIKPRLYHYRLGVDLLSGSEFQNQKEAVTLFVQRQCNSENLHYLIGSGCSLPAVPLMSETFNKIKKNNSQLKELLGEFGGNNEDIEGYMNWLKNATVFFNLESDDYKSYEGAFDTVKNGLLKTIPFEYNLNKKDQYSEGDKEIQATIENYHKFYSGIFLQRVFKKLSPINVFTTNYDLFNEIALENSGIHYANGFRGNVNRTFDPSVYRLRLVDDENRYKEKWSTVRKFVKLYKIHGSIDWKYDEHLNAIVQSSSTRDDYKDVMIYPTVSKHYETQQTPYSELFREFTINLQKKNSTLIIIGYGFPDEHINQLIAQSINNEDFTLIVFGDKSEENAQKFIATHQDKDNFHFIGGNVSGSSDGHHFHNVIQFLGNGENHDESE